MNSTKAAKEIRTALRRRSGKDWSVKHGRGTGSGWIRIASPPRRMEGWQMSEADRLELRDLLGLERCHCQGESVPASSAYYEEYVARAKGETPTRFGAPYWD